MAPSQCTHSSHRRTLGTVSSADMEEQYPLLSAVFIVAERSVDKQHGEVRRVEVRQWRERASRQAPIQSHDQIALSEVRISSSTDTSLTKVVRMSESTPPSRGEKLSASLCLHVLEICGVVSKSATQSRQHPLFGFLPFLKSFFSAFETRKM